MTVGGLLARRADALGALQAEGVGHGHQDAPWYPLHLPTETSADLRELSCAPALVDMGDGRLRSVLAYNGSFPGPTWNARTGDWITVRLLNNLQEETITHWHGLIVDYQNDGGPLLGIGPGQFYDYNFQVRQRAGLNFYHPHPHMLTGKQVCLGLAGAFIVRDAEEDALNLPSGRVRSAARHPGREFRQQGEPGVQPDEFRVHRQVPTREWHPEANAERRPRSVPVPRAQRCERPRVPSGSQQRCSVHGDR